MVAFSRVFAFQLLASILVFSNQAEAQVFEWQEFVLSEDTYLTNIAASPERLIAIGYIGTPEFGNGIAYTSEDGIEWEILDIGSGDVQLAEVVFFRNRWMVSSADGLLHTSSDGLNWSTIDIPEPLRLRWNSIVELNDEIVLIGNGGVLIPDPSARVIASTDLENWQLRYESSIGPLGGPLIVKAASSGQLLVGLGLFPAPVINLSFVSLTSSDGSNWVSSNFRLEDVVWNRDRFMGIWLWEPPLNPIAEFIPDGEWQFPDFSEAAEIQYQTLGADSSNLILSGTEGPAQLIASADGGQTWAVQDINGLQTRGFVPEFVRWQNGWVGVGESIIFGTPPEPQTVPALSGWAVQVLGLLLVLIAFVALRRCMV